MFSNIIRHVFKHLFHVPIISHLLKLSDNIMIGAIYGSFLSQNYEDSLQFSLYGLKRKRKNNNRHSHDTWWEFMKYAIKSALKVYKREYYEELRKLAINGPKPIEGREIAQSLIELSALGYSFRDKKDMSQLVELAELAGSADSSWGEPDFILGWYKLPNNEAILHFKKAINKDPSYKSRVMHDSTCNKYPEIIAQIR